MKILILGMMGPGTLEAKVHPISKLKRVDEIIFIRKSTGPSLEKVFYVTLPKVCKYSILHLLITPLITIWVLCNNKPDLIIGYHVIPYGFMVSLAGILTNTPYVVAQTGLQIQEKVTKNKSLKFFLKQVFRHSFKIFCPGTSSVESWSKIYPDLEKKYTILHSTIDVNLFKPDGEENKHYDFIFLGRLHEIKNIDLIIKSLGILNENNSLNCKLQIVGDGPEYEYLTGLTKELELSEFVHFKGFVNDPVTNLNNSNFIVMASTSEGLPTALMQGMACGLIPITNSVGNISDMVKDSVTGYTFKHLNEQEIASVMFKAINQEKEILDKIRVNCKCEIFDNHSHEAAVKKWSQCLDNLNNK